MTTYKPANTTAQWFANAHPGSRLVPNCGVLHTTEGTDWPTYDGGSKAPNYTAKPDIQAKRLVWRAHFPDEMSSRALKNLSGGVETNTANAIQVELIGTCDASKRTTWNGAKAGRDYIFWPDAPDWALRDLAVFIADMNRRHGIDIHGPAKWLPYPASFGQSNPNRMTFAQWRRFLGWCGHQHVPENEHGDPGALPWAKVQQLARDIVHPPPPPVATAHEPIATLNALGAHLTPGKLHPNMDTGPVRIRAARRALNKAGVTVCALQEFETPQANVVENSKYWRLIRGVPNNTLKNGDTAGNSLMFRHDVWTCLDSHDVPVSISGKRTLHLPFVRLQHIKTGVVVSFVVVHAPAAKGGTDTDRARVKAAALAAGADVILGDFNDRGVTLPGYTASTAGSRVLAHDGPDWILTKGLTVDEPVTLPFRAAGISDHNAVTARLTLTS